ncbi:MAG: radical SAM family heme chaperone HemW [Treponema sp.]|nr:radical SAM family heme chaperone HemW [Treponema sp.]
MICSLYIHIPFCKSKCEYCDFFSVPCGNKCIPDEYVNALLQELDVRIKLYNVHRFSTVYIGGGTPSLLKPIQLEKIMKKVLSLGIPSEITMEVNPEDVTEELLVTMNNLGINRISCGIQSLNDEVLRCVKRRGCVENIFDKIELIKKTWNGIFSVDIISALPNQSKSDFLDGLKKIVSFEPEHISMYALTIEESTPLGKKLQKGQLCYDFEAADEMWIEGRDFLINSGYVHYEVSNFAKDGFACEHNMAYWKLKNYIGIGAGAVGTIYSDRTVRWSNSTKLDSYISFWNKNLSDIKIDELCNIQSVENIDFNIQVFEYFMMGLRTSYGICKEEFEARFNMPIPEKFIKIFNEWEQKQMCQKKVSFNKTYYSLNSSGLLLLNEFLTELI